MHKMLISQKYSRNLFLYKGKYFISQKQITNIKLLISQKYSRFYIYNITLVYKASSSILLPYFLLYYICIIYLIIR